VTDLRTRLDVAAREQREAAIRALLTRPLLGQREDPQTYTAIVRHRHELAEWFADHTGWSLIVDESGGFARLHKIPARIDRTRPASAGRAARPFDRRRYVLLCVTLVVLDQAASQTTLQRLADEVTTRTQETDGIAAFDPARYAERRALVDVLKLLVDLGVLGERDGSADGYAEQGTGDALFDIDDRRIGQLIAAPNSPSMVDGPEDLPIEVYPDTEEGRRQRDRHQVVRRLLDDPVTYYDDLTAGQREWLLHSLRFVHDLLADDVGLVVERRAEGLLAVDPDGGMTDETFPDGRSTVKHAALLVADQLTARVREAGQALTVSDDDAIALVGELMAGYGGRCRWRDVYMKAGNGAELLAADVFDLLARFALVTRTADGWVPRPAIARYAPGAPGDAPP
jgi:uncharacterized protein (TIGR02678 family)